MNFDFFDNQKQGGTGGGEIVPEKRTETTQKV